MIDRKNRGFWIRFIMLIIAGGMALGIAIFLRQWMRTTSQALFAVFLAVGTIFVVAVSAFMRKLWKNRRAGA